MGTAGWNTPTVHSFQVQWGLCSISASQPVSHRMPFASHIDYSAGPVVYSVGKTSHSRRSLPFVDLDDDIRCGEKGGLKVASVSRKCEEAGALRVPRGTEQNVSWAAKESVSLPSSPDLDDSLTQPSSTSLSNGLLFSGVQSRRRRWTQVAQRVRDGRCELGVADSCTFVGLGLGVDT